MRTRIRTATRTAKLATIPTEDPLLSYLEYAVSDVNERNELAAYFLEMAVATLREGNGSPVKN